VKEENGIALIGIQLPIGFIGKFDAGERFTVVEGEIADAEDVGADVLAHGV
jgi:hypothetical protein